MNSVAGNPGSQIRDQEYAAFQKWIYAVAGIRLSDDKRTLLTGRLAKRLRARGISTYEGYLALLMQGDADELQIALDLITTHETYFWREPRHFEFLRDQVLPEHDQTRFFRIWSAACSTGEEPYTLAMILADRLGIGGFEVLASDISSRVIEDAQRGIYEMSRARDLPRAYLAKYCLKGVRSQEGLMLVQSELREKVRFCQVNLNQDLPELGIFDAIFLRNVMIYFDAEMRRRVIARLIPHLRQGGYLFIGHSETLNNVTTELSPIAAAVYQKP